MISLHRAARIFAGNHEKGLESGGNLIACDPFAGRLPVSPLPHNNYNFPNPPSQNFREFVDVF